MEEIELEENETLNLNYLMTPGYQNKDLAILTFKALKVKLDDLHEGIEVNTIDNNNFSIISNSIINKDTIIIDSHPVLVYDLKSEVGYKKNKKIKGYIPLNFAMNWTECILKSKYYRYFIFLLSSLYPREIDTINKYSELHNFVITDNNKQINSDATLISRAIASKLLSNMFYDSDDNLLIYYHSSFLNHSCDPNCISIIDSTGKQIVKTLKKIEKGEELTILYKNNELIHTPKFKCLCNVCLKKSPDNDNNNNNNSNKCNYCSKYENNLSRCSICKSVYYCNRECQKNDWKIHKENCNVIKNK
jgi:hypothetical protein